MLKSSKTSTTRATSNSKRKNNKTMLIKFQKNKLPKELNSLSQTRTRPSVRTKSTFPDEVARTKFPHSSSHQR